MSSEPINANPTVLDITQLPTRESGKSQTQHHSFVGGPLVDELEIDGFDDPIYSLSLFSPRFLKVRLSNKEEFLSHGAVIPEKSLVEDDSDELISDDNSDSLSDFSEPSLDEDESDTPREPIDAQEIYDLISTISDPEHPLTLGQLAVVNLPHIKVIDSGNPADMAEVKVEITPTITHCSLATLIGLGIRVRLERCLPPRYRITINVRPGTHQSESQVNKQLNDKERIAAACENDQLLSVISNMLSTCR